MSKTYNCAPTPAWTAWYYATARAHPKDFAVVFEGGGGSVKPLHSKAGNIMDLMNPFADTHRKEMEIFNAMPTDWDDLTETQIALIKG